MELIYLLCFLYLVFFHPIRLVQKRWHTNRALAVTYLLVFTINMALLIFIVAANLQLMPKKAKQNEAKAILGSIYIAQVNYSAENNDEYAENFEKLDFAPAGTIRYIYFMSPESFLPEKRKELTPENIPDKYKNLAFVEKNKFKAVAVGNIDNDPDLDVWAIDHTENLINIYDDIPYSGDMGNVMGNVMRVLAVLVILFYIAEPIVVHEKRHNIA